MKKNFTLMAFSAMGFIFAQTGKVGINTSTPTEIQDINGTVRVRDLPLKDTEKAIYTTGANTTETTKTTKFSPTKTVVVDDYGVLGIVSGLPTTQTFTSSSGIKQISGNASWGLGDRPDGDATELLLNSGCLDMKMGLGKGITGMAGTYTYYDIYFKIKNDAVCPTSAKYQTAVTGGITTAGENQRYQQDATTGILDKTDWTKITGYGGSIGLYPIWQGQVAIHDFSSATYVSQIFDISYFARTATADGNGPASYGAYIKQKY